MKKKLTVVQQRVPPRLKECPLCKELVTKAAFDRPRQKKKRRAARRHKSGG